MRERIYVVDDEAGMRRALTRLLRVEGFEVRAFASAQEFLDQYQADVACTCCVVLDVAMPEMDGLELQRQLNNEGAAIPIVFLTGHGDIPMSVRAVKAGAVDFLIKPVNDDDLLRAVRAALQLAFERQTERKSCADLQARFSSLTPREREIMGHVVSGKPNKEIAALLGTGEQNIKIHRGRVMEKMDVRSLPDLVRASERLSIGKLSDV